MRDQNRLYPIALAGLMLLCLASGLFNHPPLLGFWESSTVFYTFAPAHLDLNVQIHPRANIGGYGYAALELARSLAALCGFNLWTLRLIPVVCGWLSLWLFFRFVKRWYGPEPAVLGTSLLALNPVFLIYQHQYMIAIVTFACVMLCLERFQSFDEEKTGSDAALAFGAACALTSIHYAMGRLMAMAIAGFWFLRRVEPGPPSLKWTALGTAERRRAAYLALASFAFTLTALDYKNIFLLFNRRFISPDWSEHAHGASEGLGVIAYNYRFVVQAFTGSGDLLGRYATDLIVDVPYRLVSLPILALLVLGLALSIRRLRERRELFTLYLFGLNVCLPMLSQLSPSGRGTTLSTYRMYLALIPIYILVALAARWLIDNSKPLGKRARAALLVAAAALLAHQAYRCRTEAMRFRDYLSRFDCALDVPTARSEERRSLCVSPDEPQRLYTHELQGHDWQLLYRRLAERIRERMSAAPPPEGGITLIDAPVWRFSPAPYNTHLMRHNYHQLMLALYLNELGVDTAYIEVYDEDPSTEGWLLTRIKRWMRNQTRGLRKDVVDMGPSRLLPLELDFKARRYALPSGKRLYSRLRFWGPGQGRHWLVTTDEEKAAALKLLEERKISYVVLNI